MKKVSSYILSAILISSLCACGAPAAKTETAPTAETEAAPAVVSVSVQTLSQRCRADDGSDTLLLQFSDGEPTVTTSDAPAAQEAINTSLQDLSGKFTAGADDLDGLDACLAAAKAAYAQDPSYFTNGGSYSLERSVSVERGDSRVVSFLYSGHLYMGGAHDTPFTQSASFDVSSGAMLSLDDLSEDGSALKNFCESYIKALTHGEDYSGTEFSGNYESGIADMVEKGCWYLSSDGLVFTADAGELAAYAAGGFVFTVPYGKLSGLIKPGFEPISSAGDGSGGMNIAESQATANSKTVGSAVISDSGRVFTLTADGHISDVKLSSVNYSGDGSDFTDSGTRLYFSELEDGQTIGVQAEIPEVIPNLEISWRGSDGTLQRRLISESGRDGSLLLTDFQPSPSTGPA